MAKKSPLENNVSNSKETGRKSKLTTGQVTGIARLSYTSLYTYVRDFGDLFSPGVGQQHKRGRKWGAADLELVLSIRELRRSNTPAAEIHKKLAGGWRVENHSPWSSQDRDTLVEAYVTLTDETNRVLRAAEKEVEQSKFVSQLGLEDYQRIGRLEQKDKELEMSIYKILKHFHLVRELDEKKPWWKRLGEEDE